MGSQEEVRHGVRREEQHKNGEPDDESNSLSVAKHVHAVLIDLPGAVRPNDRDKVVAEEGPDEADIASSPDNAVGEEHDCVSDEQVASVVLRRL